VSDILDQSESPPPSANLRDGAWLSEPPGPRMPAQRETCMQPEVPSLGELKARHRELHLCLRCSHHLVCGMAKALDPNLLVTIVTCLGFEPDGSTDAKGVCELLPLEPLPTT
jgi:hypothetical protein